MKCIRLYYINNISKRLIIPLLRLSTTSNSPDISQAKTSENSSANPPDISQSNLSENSYVKTSENSQANPLDNPRANIPRNARANTHENANDDPHKPKIQRTGLIGLKLGMTRMWDKTTGEAMPITVLHIKENNVIYARNIREHNVNALVIGAGDKSPEIVDKPSQMLNKEEVKKQYKNKWREQFFLDAGVPIKHFSSQFRVSPSAFIPVGTQLIAGHFRPGQLVHVLSQTISKGFQGVMKRWGFHGMPASHGQTKTHRKMGNVAAQGLGRVWKGTKMPGHMGGKVRRILNLEVMRVNHKFNLLYLRGLVPGKSNDTWVKIVDSDSDARFVSTPPVKPFPTFSPTTKELLAMPIEEFHPNVYVPGEESLLFVEDTKRITPERLVYIRTMKKHVLNLDIALDTT